ncbi:hypothetical protein ACSX1A_05065 [Pontibacter sp. MBLB2868]|uniref:hypothetical protein n=1 Tax=Pontibacter sp. MBLB2868 TaxID=3451555 RepID=UPI003F74C4D1
MGINTEIYYMFREKLNITIDLEHRILCTEWLRGMNRQQYRRGLRSVRKLISENNLKFWLVCTNEALSPNVADQKWVATRFFSLLLKTPLKKIAFVLPSDHFIYMLAESLIKKLYRLYGDKIELEAFSRTEHARHWLFTSDEAEHAFAAS